MAASQPVAEYDRPDRDTFATVIYPQARPAILRGVGADLEPVQLARLSTGDFARYLKQTVGPRDFDILAAKSGAGATFFFEGDVSRLNFDRTRMGFHDFVDRAVAAERPDAMLYMEATRVSELSPELGRAVELPIAPNGIEPLVWLGNRTGVQTHFDYKQNIAYVVCGKRRFTLFPPEQTPNLYMAPFERAPSGAPVSTVRFDDPDFEKYPRYREALEHSLVAELEAGDALYVPYMWWHHVQALGEFNMLVNYWWNEYEVLGSQIETLLHAILTVRDLPPPMRDAWRAMFETFVFKAHGEPMDHVEPHLRGGMGPLNGQQRAELWHALGTSITGTVQRILGGSGPR